MQKNTSLRLKHCPFQDLMTKSTLELESVPWYWLYFLLNASVDIWIVKDGEGRWQVASEWALKLFKLKEIEYRGKTDKEIIECSEFDRAVFFENEVSDEEIWRKKAVIYSEIEIAVEDGLTKVFQVEKVPFFYPDGTRQRMVVIFRDLTERKQLQQELSKSRRYIEELVNQHQSEIIEINQKLEREIAERQKAEKTAQRMEERYQAIVKDRTEQIVRFAPDGTILFANEACCRYFGKQPEETIGSNFMELVLEEDRKKVYSHIACLNCENPVATIEHRSIAKNGEIRWQQWTTRGIFDERGWLVEFQSVGRDISDRVRAEEALKASEAKYKVLFETLPMGIAIADKEGNIVEVNQAAEKILGISADDNILTNYDSSKGKLIRSDGTPMPKEEFACARALRENRIIENFETGIVKPNGKINWISVTAAPIPLSNYGVAIGYVDITDRKQIEEALRESEERFRNLVNSAPLLLWTADLDGKFNFFNQGWLDFRGRTLTQEVGAGWMQGIHPEDLQLCRETYFLSLKHRLCFEIEYRLERNDGVYRWIVNKGVPQFNVDGIFEGYIGLCFDITKRKQMEEELRHREQEFKALVENSPDIIARFDRQLHYTYVNPAVQQATGISPQKFIGKSYQEVGFLKQKISCWSKLLDKVLATGSEETIEFDFPTSQGNRYYHSRIVPEFSARGLVDSILCITYDITERKQAEAALRESEERFRQMAENCNEVFWIATADLSQLLYISPAYEKVWGHTCSSLYQQPRTWLDAIHPDDRDRVISHLKSRLTAHNDKDSHQEYRIVRPDGSICWIGDRSFCIRNESGEIYRLAGIARDITEYRLTEEAIRQQTERERLVATMTQRIRRTLNLEEILNTTVLEVQQLLGCDRVLIYRVWPEGTGSVVTEAVNSTYTPILGRTYPEEVFPQDYHQLYCQGRVRIIPDVENSNVAPCLVDFLRELQVRSKVVLPLTHGDELWGLLIAHQCRSAREWQPFEISWLQQLSTQLAIAIQQASLFEQLQAANQELQRLASLDGLTQVANRRSFDEYLDREWRRLTREQLPLALILCDIDYFKNYNDTYGHQAGDECLQQVAKAIKRSLKRAADFVARYGGEEFAIILPNTKAEGALMLAEEIRSSVRKLHISHAKSQVSEFVTLSLGVAVIVPTQKCSAEKLIHTADLGLYEAKDGGRDRAILKVCR